MKEYFHVTTDESLPIILKEGLKPLLGERSEGIEEVPAIFLFPNEEDMDNALGNWLGECFDDYEGELHSLLVRLPDDFPIVETSDWERMCLDAIPSSYISYHKNQH